MTRKILYSPGFGAGWTTWNDGEVAKYMLTYQPIVEFIEGGGSFKDRECSDLPGYQLHPLLARLREECAEKFNAEHVCMLGADGLQVMEVDGDVRIEEYDGSESVITRQSDSGWM